MDISSRTLSEAKYIIETGCTLRQCAVVFKTGKSTVHTDMTQRLPTLDKKMWERVSKILLFNGSVKHIRGGMSTRKKYADGTISLPCPTDYKLRDA